MIATIPELKARLKRGPKLSRRLLGEFALVLANSPARPLRQLKPEALTKIKIELMRLAGNGNRQSFKYVQEMYRRYPELKNS